MCDNIQKINFKEYLRKFLKNNFSKKNNIWRLVWFATALFIVLTPAIPMNILAYKHGEGHWSGNNAFIILNVSYNPGNGFGWGSEWPQGAVYFVKTFLNLIILCFALFSPCKWFYTLPLCTAFIGGFFNVFDKVAHNNNVIDYFELFPKHSWFIFNIPDFYITGGIVFVCTAIMFNFIKQIIKDKKKTKGHTQ
jgi:lipoprotein signal peptidase